MTAHLTIQQRTLARRLRAKGMSLRDIAKGIGCSHSGIDVMVREQERAVRPITWTPRQGRLTVDEWERLLDLAPAPPPDHFQNPLRPPTPQVLRRSLEFARPQVGPNQASVLRPESKLENLLAQKPHRLAAHMLR